MKQTPLISWEMIQEQFRTVARLVQDLEERVLKAGRLGESILDEVANKHRLNDAGTDLLASLIQQSPRMVVIEDPEGRVFLEPNPLYPQNMETPDGLVIEVDERGA